MLVKYLQFLKVVLILVTIPNYLYITGFGIGYLTGRNYQLYYTSEFQFLLVFLRMAQWLVLVVFIAAVWKFPITPHAK